MIINDVVLEDLDVFDADVVEKYEKILEKTVKETNEIEGLKRSAAIRKQCSAIFKCFNELFGAGTDKKIFGDKTNILVCIKAFEQLILQTNEQNKELDKIFSKYSPNRLKKK